MIEFKYLIFFAVLIVGVPLGYQLAIRYRLVERLVFLLFIFFTCEMVDINFYSMENYRGTSKGFEFGMVDITMYIVAALVFKRTSQYPVCRIPPGSLFYLLYFVFSCISLVHSDVLIYSGFEILKMLRMYLYFWIAFNYIREEEHFHSLVQFGAIITVYIFFTVLKQKYIENRFQSMGPFPHQNSLTMYISLLGSLALSRLLNVKSANMTLWGLIFFMAAFCVLSTLSRAGLALFAVNCSIVFILSLLLRDQVQREVRSRKWTIVLIMPLVVSAGLYKASDSIVERFTTAPPESRITRLLLAEAAIKMANENLFGIGLNNFAHKINDPYPYGAHIPTTISRDGDKRGLVETSYLMIAAEAGWPSLLVFCSFLIFFYIKNIINLLRLKNSGVRYICVALVGCLTQIYLQTTLEWVLKQTNNFYQLMLMFAMIGSIGRLQKTRLTGLIPAVTRTNAKSRGNHCVTTL